MIKCDKGKVHANGNGGVLLAEFSCICAVMAEEMYKSTKSKCLVNKVLKTAVKDGIAEGFKKAEESEG